MLLKRKRSKHYFSYGLRQNFAALALCIYVTASSAHAVTVGAAASLKDVVESLTAKFEQRADVSVTFGGSNAIARQIGAGAAIDLFLSADLRLIKQLKRRGLIAGVTPLAGNRLVIVAPQQARAHDWPGFLARDKAMLALAYPAVPLGGYSREVLLKRNTWSPLRQAKRLVFAEHARAVVGLVTSGAAQAGIIYQSDYYRYRDQLALLDTIPLQEHTPIVYHLAEVQRREPPSPIAKTFAQFCAAEFAQRLFALHHFVRLSTDAR